MRARWFKWARVGEQIAATYFTIIRDLREINKWRATAPHQDTTKRHVSFNYKFN